MEYVVVYNKENKQVLQMVESLDKLKKLGRELQKSRIDYKVYTNIKYI